METIEKFLFRCLLVLCAVNLLFVAWNVGTKLYQNSHPGPPKIESTPRKVSVQPLGDDADRVRYLQIWMVEIDGKREYFGEVIEGGEK
ncbi:hypothetical protein QP248_02740 [Aerococcus sp. UMB8608]|uniref:Uncharacterized protein n=1 Tax=Aerococcus sanguinicola TaxID=119206 RepID=A0A0X8F9W8_9LACT|nr:MULTISPECIES: hypothetical protein [Aerococcus]AMB93268.1 hypothetical protein AWM72_00030 [Aerococcus sanguinicola]MDK6679367.1 hypothetical protein [Aerococcus sp. UMB8608]MDK6685791.1 hypothetical protein [Aerococcus sp. UMB8623]